ncbi:glycyl-tRNA synthetase [Aspergillus filifer]
MTELELTTRSGDPFDRAAFESLLKRRFFYTESFEIYRTSGKLNGDARGFFDYGPPGCALQSNIVDTWHKHFVLQEDMLELDCTTLIPESDWICKDSKNGEFLRADHLVEAVLEARLKGDKVARGLENIVNEDGKDVAKKKKRPKVSDVKAHRLDDNTVEEYEEILAKIDNYDGPELGALIKKHEIRNSDDDAPVEPPVRFNLIFKTTIGPSGVINFWISRNLSSYNQNSMPFASASIGKSFRNEVSPRSGLPRVREFLMAEIEHFVDPEGGKKHPKFHLVKNLQLHFLDQATQLASKKELSTTSLEDAVSKRLVDNETLAYFLCRIYLFLLRIGVAKSKIRFRQHMANEMAHYATDCWDAEPQTSYGSIECVGCADRSAYDLTVHSTETGEPLVVQERRQIPLKVEEWQVDINRAKLGPTFKKDAKAVKAALTSLSQTEQELYATALENKGRILVDVPGLCEKAENIREYIPNVIEPSFGIGRILCSLLEHAYWHRPNNLARGVLSLPISVAPTKVLIVPLSTHPALSSASIGKRYARNDELGIPLGITVDFDSVKDGTVTLRERDSTKQVRASQEDILCAVRGLVTGLESWDSVFSRLPKFSGQSGDD